MLYTKVEVAMLVVMNIYAAYQNTRYQLVADVVAADATAAIKANGGAGLLQ